MSSVSQQPRRVSGTMEQRPARESGERLLVRYDSEEAPVLIRLPDISATRVEAVLAATETHAHSKRASNKNKGRRPSREDRAAPPVQESKAKPAISAVRSRMPSKLVVAGIIVGLSLGTLIFLNGGKKVEPAAEQDLWSANDNVTATEPEVSLPGDDELGEVYSQADIEPRQGTQAVPPDRPLEVPTMELAPPELVRQPLPQEGNQPLPTHSTPLGWPDEAQVPEELPAPALGAPVENWPPEIEIAGPRSRSEAAPDGYSDEPTYRSGMRPSHEPNSRVLDGTIETPTPRADYERTKTRLY